MTAYEVIMNDFKIWWDNEGSGMKPKKEEDMEEFVYRMTMLAWDNGAFKQREQFLRGKENES
jgi:hypothetical protein